MLAFRATDCAEYRSFLIPIFVAFLLGDFGRLVAEYIVEFLSQLCFGKLGTVRLVYPSLAGHVAGFQKLSYSFRQPIGCTFHKRQRCLQKN